MRTLLILMLAVSAAFGQGTKYVGNFHGNGAGLTNAGITTAQLNSASNVLWAANLATNTANITQLNSASNVLRTAQIAATNSLLGTINANFQPLDADLTAIAALTTTSFGRGLLDDADATAGRVSLGTVIGVNVQAYDADLTTYAGITPSANVQTLLGAASYSAFRTSLGVAIGSDVQAYDTDLTTWAGITPGTGVGTMLGYTWTVGSPAAGNVWGFSGAATLTNGPPTAYLPLTGGTMTGNLLFTDNTYDIGASGATRPRNVYVAGTLTIGGASTFSAAMHIPDLQWDVGGTLKAQMHRGNAKTYLASDWEITYSSTTAVGGTADLGYKRNAAGVLEINNGTAGTYADLILRGISFSGTTASFPAIKRNGTAINFRLADDSAAAPVTTGALVVGGGTSVANIRHGVSGAMVLGAVTVTDTGCTANTRYFFSAHTLGTIAIPGGYYASTRTASTSFVITSSQATETSTIDWMAIEP